MEKLFRLIKDYFYVLLMLCMVLALTFPRVFSGMYPYLEHYLIVMLFIAFLKTDFKLFSKLIRKPSHSLLYAIYNLVIVPVAFWTICFFLPYEYRIAVLIIVIVPQGVATPSLLDLIGGSIEKGVSFLIMSYLLAPFTIVAILKYLAKVKINLSYTSMFNILVQMIFLPLLTAWIVKKLISEKTIQKGETFLTLTTISMMLCLTLGTFSHESKSFLVAPSGLVKPLALVTSIFGVLFIAGLLFSRLFSRDDYITPVITTVFTNNTLAIVLASKFFSQKVFFLTLLTMIPWKLFLIPAKVFAKRISLSTDRVHTPELNPLTGAECVIE